MTYLNYYAHILLQSKYRLILFLTFYIIIIFCYNYNNINYAYCEENSINNTTSNNKLLGMSLFLSSIALILFIQNSSTGADPSTIIDLALNVCENHIPEEHSHIFITPQNIQEQNTQECLDFFNISSSGTLDITGIAIDTKNVYLNADKALLQMKQNLSNQLNMLIEPIRQFHFRQEPGEIDVFLGSQAFIDAHAVFLKNMDNLITKQTILLHQNYHFINGLTESGILNSTYLDIYHNYLQEGHDPVNFSKFLISRIQR